MSNFDFDFELRLKNMGEKTQENSQMGYSAACPTMRRRSSASEGGLAKGEPEGTARGRARSVAFFKVSSF